MFKTKHTNSTKIGVCDRRALKHNAQRTPNNHSTPTSKFDPPTRPAPFPLDLTVQIPNQIASGPSIFPTTVFNSTVADVPTFVSYLHHNGPTRAGHVTDKPQPSMSHVGISSSRHPSIVARHLSLHHWSSKLTRVKFLTYQTIMKQENNTL